MRQVLVSLLLRLSRVSLARTIFFRLPLVVRLKLRQSLIRNELSQKNSSIDLTEAANRIHRFLNNQSLQPKKVKWETTGFSRTSGSAVLDDDKVVDDYSSRITLDFWDTLIGRTRPAEGAKRLTALRFSIIEWASRGFVGRRESAAKLHHFRLDSESKQVAAQGEAKILTAIGEMSPVLGTESDLTQKLVTQEIEDEKTYTSFIAAGNLDSLLSGRRFEVVSDFYMSGDSLRQIMEKNRPGLNFVRYFSSADYFATKRDSGKLFSLLNLHEEKDWLHIGDSQHSDYDMARLRGARSRLVSRKGTSAWNGNELDFHKLARDVRCHLGTDEPGEYIVDLAIIGVALVTFAYECALEKGKNQIVYVSREGHTLYKIHRYLQASLTEIGLPKIDPVYFPSSRSSVFFPSFADNLEQGFRELSIQYPVSTRDSLIDSVGAVGRLAEQLSLRFSKFQKLSTDNIFKQLGEPLAAELNKHSADQLEKIKKIIMQLGLSAKDALVCDLGWRGTINDSMSRILGFEIPGVYLGLFSSNSDYLKYRDKTGLMFDQNKNPKERAVLDFLGPLERAFTLDDYSVASYIESEDGVFYLQKTAKDGPSKARAEFIEANLSNAVATAWDLMKSCGIFGFESGEFVAETVRKWMSNPNAYHAATWFDEIHLEGFGTNDVHYSKLNLAKEGSDEVSLSRVETALRSSLWPAGYEAWIVGERAKPC